MEKSDGSFEAVRMSLPLGVRGSASTNTIARGCPDEQMLMGEKRRCL